MATNRTSKTETKVSRHTWEHADRFGRKIGLNVITWEAQYEAKGADDPHPRCGYSHAAGHYFVACCQPSRDGENYGASQDDRHFATEAERADYIARRMKDSQKAAAKKAGK